MKSGSNLEKVLEGGHFAVTAEVGPPKGTSASVIQKKGDILKSYCDALNVTDNQTAIVRMSSLSGCVILIRMGIDPVMQMVVRDRNRIAIQSDILGAVALGIRNLLCLSGDHQKFGNHPTAKNVYDIDSIQLVKTVKTMRDEKKFLCGENISGEVPLFIGAVENPFADPFEYRVIRLAKKVQAGADFIQTQAVYDVGTFVRWMEMVRDQGLDRRVHILAGVIPIKSVGMARYMRDNVSGVSVPNEIVTRLEDAKDVKEEGVKITLEIIEQIKEIDGIHGIHIMAVAWEDIVPVIAERAGLLPRPIL
ncbi:MAG TPA: methylenetetrahydrofolate reductase [Thermodesulfovibrionales bacterium]|jgi:5,10-methylenetetrahydrofolate reductase|nr:methylenetetrahydrofolate reductase [Thermodesulfovibrionales bacterium]